jgi:hypothetical protein
MKENWDVPAEKATGDMAVVKSIANETSKSEGNAATTKVDNGWTDCPSGCNNQRGR